MKPFNNVAISSTEPKNKADVWIQHSKNIFNSKLEKGSINFQTGSLESSSNAVRTTDYIPIEPNTEYTINRINGTGSKAFAIRGYDSTFKYLGYISTFTENIKTFKTITSNIDGMPSKNTPFTYMKFVDYDNNTNAKYMINKGNQALPYENYVEDDIKVNNNGIYNSVLTKEITTGIEIKTNRRIDGKDIYYKRIDLGTGPNATSKAYSIGINFNNIVDANVFVKGSANSLKLPFLAQDAQEFINYYFQSNQIIIQAGKDRRKYNFYLDIYYTK